MRTIAIGADHAGFELKNRIRDHLISAGFETLDCGTDSAASVDYPVFAEAVGRSVADGQAQFGIMVDGAGIGSAMAANKIAGVRAALCYDLSSARNSREHNNANVLTLGASLIGAGLATQIVDTFLATECTAERHLRRAKMIDALQGSDSSVSATAPSVRADGGTPQASTAATGAAQDAIETMMSSLSESDLQRVADRIAAMLSGQAGGPEAANLAANAACGFCRTCAEIDPQLVRGFIGMGADRIVHRGDGQQVPADIAAYIDHTLLRPDTTTEQIDRLCDEAARFHFASVCINPCYVARCAQRLKSSGVKVCTVVGFPLGANTSQTKALEARRAIREGASEIDMVINVGALKSGDDELVYKDIRAVVEACMDGGALCKVILETALLTADEKTRACAAARRARADYVKTSTGFGPGGATADDVALMREAVAGTRMGVKASGGIRSFDEARKMIQAGATRLGASAGVRIVKESRGVTVSDQSSSKY